MMTDSAAAAAARPDDEEARRRRSTDCIYYLASPLTCKKGSECEYRHSDAARMNPRGCWYWFNASCTNPKCSFRHPPLDNLLGAQATPPAIQESAPQVPVPPQSNGSSSIPSSGTAAAKQGVPCYYFQKGMCAKGDRCAFLHVPQVAGNSPQPMQKVFTAALQPNTQSKNTWTKSNSAAQQTTASSMFDKSKVSARDGKPAQKQNLTRRVDQPSRIYQKHSNSDVQSGSVKHYRPQPSVEDGVAGNGVEVGEFVRDLSAGSGVPVGRINYNREQSSKANHNSYHHTASGEQNTGMRQTHGSHEPDRPYRSSGETLLSDKRISQREPMNVTAGGLDLRHRLLKQRRLSDPRSTQAPDRQDTYIEDHHRRRGNENAAHDGLARSRLHGRIKLPGETSFDRLGLHSERVKDREPRARLSPPKHTDLRGKLHERLKVRPNEDIPGNEKSFVEASIDEDTGSLNFAGPKSLAELKAKKIIGSSGEGAVSNSTASSVALAHRTSETVGGRDSSESVPFEGPKPLSIILKRKREATSADSGSIREEEEEAAGAEGESQNELQIPPESDPTDMNTEANGEEEEEDFHPEDDMAYDDNLYPADENAVDDAGRELEDVNADAAQDYEYDAGEKNADEDNEYQEYEDDDDLEDDDDFARKVDVMIS